MIVAWFNKVATNYVARLAAEGLPALADGQVMLGPENSVPVISSASPRLTLVPIGGSITKKAPGTPVTSPAFDSPDYQVSITQPWIWTDIQAWRADVSGVQYAGGIPASDLTQNWDFTAAMLYVLIQSFHQLMEGAWKPLRYEWIDSQPRSTKLGGFGRMISFYFEVYTPVLLYNLNPFVLPGSGLALISGSGEATIGMNLTGGSSGDTINITVGPPLT